MILTDYYRFDKRPEIKSKLRLDCTASTASYKPLEAMRNKRGELFAYLGDNSYTKAGREGKAELALTHGDTHISSIYLLEVHYAYGVGDMIHTPDAIVFVFSNFEYIDGHPREGSRLELFIARGNSHNKQNLFTKVCEGALEQEMCRLRAMAQPEAERLPK